MGRLNIYEAKVINQKTKKSETVTINALTFEEARNRALTSGTIVSVKKTGTASSSMQWKPKDRITFMTSLGTMLKSGVGTIEALEALENSKNNNRSIKNVAKALRERIKSGTKLTEAMEEIGTKIFSPNIIAFVKAGSQDANLGVVFKEAADFDRELLKIKKESVKGLWSAIIGFVVAVIASLGGIFYLGPMMKNNPLFNMFPVDTGWIDVIAYSFGGVLAFVGFLGVIYTLLITFGKELMPVYADRILLKIPIIKEIVLARECFITFYSISKLLGSNVSISNALKLTHDSAREGMLKNDFKKAYETIKEGEEDWSSKMELLDTTDKLTLSMSTDRFRTAEILRDVSDEHRLRYSDRLSALIPSLAVFSGFLLTIGTGIIFIQSMLPPLMVMGEMF